MAENETITPLPGQLTFPALEEKPQTNSRWMRKAWHDGKTAALAGKSLLDVADPPPRGYGESISAKRAHRHYCLEYRRWWAEGFRSVTLFPIRREDKSK